MKISTMLKNCWFQWAGLEIAIESKLNEINIEWQDHEYKDARLLLSCLNKESLGIFKNWRDIGIFLFSLAEDSDESYLKLWLDLAEKSCKFTSDHCHKNWKFFKKNNYKNIKSLYVTTYVNRNIMKGNQGYYYGIFLCEKERL